MMIRTLLAACTFLLTPTARADVFTVGVPGDFVTIQAAVDAAADGDVVVVRESHADPGGVVVDGKGLAIVGDPSNPTPFVSVPGAWTIRNLGPFQTVALANLRVSAGNGPALSLLDNAGPVLIGDCRLLGGLASGCDTSGRVGLWIRESAEVEVTDALIVGGNGSPSTCGDANGGDGAAGLRIQSSFVAVRNSTLKGGDGSAPTVPCSGLAGGGGDGLRQSMLFPNGSAAFSSLVACTSLGGLAGPNDCGPDGFGGASLTNIGSGSQSQVVHQDTQLPDTVLGLAISALSGPGRWIDSPGATLAPGVTTIRVHGAPGERVWLRIHGSWPGPAYTSTNFVWQAPSAWFSVGVVPANGELSVSLPAHLPSGVEALARRIDARVLTTRFGLVDAGSVPWVVLDPNS